MTRKLASKALSCAFVFSLVAACNAVITAPITTGPSGSSGSASGPGSSSSSSDVSSSGNVSSSASSGSSGAGGSGGGPAACSPADKAMRWAKMVKAPILLPGHAALLDLAGPANQGLTMPEAEQILCQGSVSGDPADGGLVETWGNAGEVWLAYAPGTMTGSTLTLWAGYVGTVKFKGSNGVDAYEIPVNSQLVKNGLPFTLDWGQTPVFSGELDELCRGLMATFTNAALDPPGTTCVQSGKCIWGTFGDIGFVLFKPVGLALWVASHTAPQPTPSIPQRLEIMKP